VYSINARFTTGSIADKCGTPPGSGMRLMHDLAERAIAYAVPSAKRAYYAGKDVSDPEERFASASGCR